MLRRSERRFWLRQRALVLRIAAVWLVVAGVPLAVFDDPWWVKRARALERERCTIGACAPRAPSSPQR